MESLFKKLGVHIPEILLPAKGISLTRWSVIACDQYTSQPDYWQKVNEEVNGSPSALRLTLPEIYLKDDDKDTRISHINETMQQYVREGTLVPQRPGFILVDRSTPHTASRKGLILAVDLECYDYRPGSQTLIRATEGTVLDRIPPRVKIRENAPIELPHIMLLIDDPDRTVIEPLFERASRYEKLYDFDLMQGGGHIKGWKVEDGESLSLVGSAIEKLADPAAFARKYGIKSEAAGECSCSSGSSVLLFAAGDGNHSLASAKAHWENVKAALLQQGASAANASPGKTPGQSPESDNANSSRIVPDHPARYALVEVVNVHDEGLVFEPIHRVLFGIHKTDVLGSIKNICNQESNAKHNTEYTRYDSKASMDAAISSMNCTGSPKCTHLLPFILEGTYGLITAHAPSCSLEVGTLQSFIDELVKNNSNMEVDYIHGDQVVTELGSQPGCMGFFLPVMDKHDLFRTVLLDGVLPRKTFSMGEAEEKRYYLECRSIK